MSEFTKGPWRLNICAGDDWSFSRGQQVIVEADSIAGAPARICLYACDDAEELANARLIAAAPQLLEALERCLQWIEADEASHGREFGCGNQARTALAKARGEK